MKRGPGIFIALAMSAVILNSCDKDDDDDNSNTTSQTDRTFIRMASMGNYAEISAGQTAAGKAQDSAIAAFGQMMVTDHTTAGQQLKTLVSSFSDVDSTSLSNSLDAEHVALSDSLMSLSGSQFDSVYIQRQVRDHVKTIALFQGEASGGSNQRLKQFANNLLPQLQMHLQMADSLAANP